MQTGRWSNAADQLQGRVWVRPASDHRPRGLVSCIRMLDHAVTLVQDSRHAVTSDARLKASPPEHSERVDGHDSFGARVHRPSTGPRSVAVRRRPLKGSGVRASRPVSRTEAPRRHAPRRLECITSEKASRAVRARRPFEAPPATPLPTGREHEARQRPPLPRNQIRLVVRVSVCDGLSPTRPIGTRQS